MKKVLAVGHLMLLLASLSSPFWADWKIVVIGFLLYELQKILFKGCLLSFAEFGSSDKKPREHFTPYYLKKYFQIKADDRVVMIYLDYVVAPLVPVLSIIIQVIFHYQPLAIL
jgi:hypothetical protein